MIELLASLKSPLLLSQVAKRKYVSLEVGGDVKFADPTNKKYPLDTVKHVQAACSCINMPKNAAIYSADDLKAIKGRIKAAAKQCGVTITKEEQSVLDHLPDFPLTQDHYHIKDSFEDHLSVVGSTFRAWCRAHTSSDYYWGSILGVFSDTVVFYVDNYSAGIKYYALKYTMTIGSSVEFEDDVEEIDVNLVVSALGVAPEEQADMTEKEKEAATEVQAEAATEVQAEAATVPAENQTALMTADRLIQGDPYAHSGESLCFIQSTTIDAGKHMHIEGIVTRADIVNAKDQVYPLSVWKKCVERMNQEAEAGKFLGKLEHPGKEQGLMDAAMKWNKFWIQGADVWGECTVVPTEPHGKNLQALVEAGVQIDFSTRGYGSSQVQDWRGKEHTIIQDDFVCTALDAVWKGASTGSGAKKVEYQSEASGGTQGEETKVEVEVKTQAQERAEALIASTQLKQSREALINSAALAPVGMDAYKKALGDCATLEDMFAKSDTILPVLQSTFPVPTDGTEVQEQSATYMPQFFVKQDQAETAPKNVGELIDRLVQDLPDGPNVAGVPGQFVSQRKACKKMMVSVANERQGSFDGRSAALGLLALEQGKIDRAQDILTQSLQTGATVAAANADGGGAPLSNYLIFPLIRRVFPQYIMNEIASIQPMDRPDGKIFYLDQYRTEDPAGNEKRIDLNTSANPFNSSYADNAVEGATAMLMRLRLASVAIAAHTKKLGAAWSIEEMQDLRAYHGLDAAQELLGAIAREMALEWNKEVLDDMIQQATAGALTFGTTAPVAGFTDQKDWDEYIWVYLQKLDNLIFSKRNGPMTHLVVGIDAALALAKSMRGALTIGGNSKDNAAEMEIYPGTTFYGSIATPNGSRYKVLKTNFWGSGTANGSKILGLRRGSEWSDTPYIWAPYTDYVTPMLTDPNDFSQKQGIISRAGKKVVVADAMGTVTVSTGQGVVV